jgi:Double zinc ribbon
MDNCPSCGARLDSGTDRCRACGWRPTPGVEPPGSGRDAPVPPADRDRPDIATHAGPWNCPKCRSLVDPDFDVCWNCGTTADGVEDPHFVREEDAGTTDADDDFDRGDSPMADDEVDSREVLQSRSAERAEPLPDRPMTCTRCGGEMALGYVAFPTRRGPLENIPETGAWIAGRARPAPRTETWSGAETSPLQAYRCEDCGRIEFYARSS